MKTGSICAICAAALSLCLCSCSHSGGPKPCDIDENFSGDVTITQNEKTYSAKLSRGAADVWEMEFSKPDTVSGMKLDLADGNLYDRAWDCNTASTARIFPGTAWHHSAAAQWKS